MRLRDQRLREDLVSRPGARYRLEARLSGAVFDCLLSSNTLVRIVLWATFTPVSWLLNHLAFRGAWAIVVIEDPVSGGG
jgi:hypothetical protein